MIRTQETIPINPTAKMESKTRYRLLLLAPSFEEPGGAVGFCRMLLDHLNGHFCVTHFEVGSREGHRNLIQRIFTFLSKASRLRTILKKHRYNVVQLNPSFKILSLIRDSVYLLILDKSGLSKKTLVFFHGWDERLAQKILRLFFLRKAVRRIYAKARLIVVLYDRCKDQLIRMGIDPQKIIVGTTMYEEIGDLLSSEQRRHDLIQILFMARLVKDKGVFIAAGVGKRLRERGFNKFRLIMAGDGPEMGRLKDYRKKFQLDDYMTVTGFVRGEKKKELLRTSDIFLYPSHYGEGCPLVILEAMGAGLAIVSTGISAIPFLIKHNSNGLLIDSRDPEDFYLAVKRLIEDEKLRRNMQRLNKLEAEQKYEAGVITRRIEDLYLSIVNETVPAQIEHV